MEDPKSEHEIEQTLDQLESKIRDKSSSPKANYQVRNQIKKLYKLTETSGTPKKPNKTSSDKLAAEADSKNLSPTQIVDIVSDEEDRAKDRLRGKTLGLNDLREILNTERKGKDRESLKRFISREIKKKRDTTYHTGENPRGTISFHREDTAVENNISRRKIVEELKERFDEGKLEKVSDEDLKKIYQKTKNA